MSDPPLERTFRSHQVPVAQLATNPKHLKILERWMKSYRPQELFDENGTLVEELAEPAPKGERRMGANAHANGRLLLRDLKLPCHPDHFGRPDIPHGSRLDSGPRSRVYPAG